MLNKKDLLSAVILSAFIAGVLYFNSNNITTEISNYSVSSDLSTDDNNHVNTNQKRFVWKEKD